MVVINNIKCCSSSLKSKNWLVFYHFVGAVPGSTELEALLKRLLVEMKVVDVCICSNISKRKTC